MSPDIDVDNLDGPEIDRRTTVKLLSAAGMGGLAGCTGGGGEGDSSGEGDSESESDAESSEISQGGRLDAAWFTGSIDSLDPPYISVGQFFQAAANIFSGLVTLSEDLSVRGDLAKNWTVEDNGATITFDLREDVTFHNGDEFTAEDVAYTIRRTIGEETPAAGKLNGLQSLDDGGIEIVDDYTITLRWGQPNAVALIYLTRGPGRAATIVNQNAIEEMGAEQYAVEPVGTGPFEVASHDVGNELVLDAYDDYFETDENGIQLPYLDGVTVRPIPEPSSVVNALQSGDVQFSNLIPLENVSQIENADSVTKLQAPGVNWYGFAMNQSRDPFGSRDVRMGIAKSIDNDAFNEAAYFGNALSARGPINRATQWVYREDKPDAQAYDPEAGQEMIEAAGVDGASFSILASESDLRQAKAMRQQLNSAGFDVEIDQVTSSTYWDRYANLDYDTTISGSVGDPDPDQSLWNFYRLPDEDGVWNWVDYESETTHQLLAEQRQSLDREQRASILQELEDQLIQDVPHAYLSHQRDIGALRNDVKGFVHTPFTRHFHRVYLDD